MAHHDHDDCCCHDDYVCFNCRDKADRAHPRHERHDVRNPAEGDGSCWITPEGYILLDYEGHYLAVRREGFDGYIDAFKAGWIRVGIFRGEEAGFRLHSAYLVPETVMYLKRILGGLLKYEKVRLDDENREVHIDDRYTEKAPEIRRLVNGYAARLPMPTPAQMELALGA